MTGSHTTLTKPVAEAIHRVITKMEAGENLSPAFLSHWIMFWREKTASSYITENQ